MSLTPNRLRLRNGETVEHLWVVDGELLHERELAARLLRSGVTASDLEAAAFRWLEAWSHADQPTYQAQRQMHDAVCEYLSAGLTFDACARHIASFIPGRPGTTFLLVLNEVICCVTGWNVDPQKVHTAEGLLRTGGLSLRQVAARSELAVSTVWALAEKIGCAKGRVGGRKFDDEVRDRILELLGEDIPPTIVHEMIGEEYPAAPVSIQAVWRLSTKLRKSTSHVPVGPEGGER